MNVECLDLSQLIKKSFVCLAQAVRLMFSRSVINFPWKNPI